MGRDKALIDVGGETLLERTVRIAQKQSETCVLIGHVAFELSDSLAELRRVFDSEGGAGPMAGLAGLVAAFPDLDCLLLACDMPQLSIELLERLWREAGSCDADAIIPETMDRDRVQRHPCCAIYRASARPHIEAAIAARRYGMTAMLERMRVHSVRITGEMAGHLLNWNSPLDLLGGKRLG